MSPLRFLTSLIAPPRCAACGAACPHPAVLCDGCRRELGRLGAPAASPMSDLTAAWAAVAHEGVARRLVAALKFRGMLAVAEEMAGQIAAAAPPSLFDADLVPVPPAPRRLRRRGFDPAEEIAVALAGLTGLRMARCLERLDGPQQLGRSRAQRITDPPVVRAVATVPGRAVLVDDVQTTGATLRACAGALRRAGAKRVVAVTFARRL